MSLPSEKFVREDFLFGLLFFGPNFSSARGSSFSITLMTLYFLAQIIGTIFVWVHAAPLGANFQTSSIKMSHLFLRTH